MKIISEVSKLVLVTQEQIISEKIDEYSFTQIHGVSAFKDGLLQKM